MPKRIVVCADGTWNRPEEDIESDHPTNVLRLARAITAIPDDGIWQHVFYDWGVGSYDSKVLGGATGRGIHKNILDGYRYIVQNYTPGSQIFLFGFSRGAYTVRSLCGLINNCGILRKSDANLIQEAFRIYKRTSSAYAPSGAKSREFRGKYAHESREVAFLGVWDTVGALGIPFSLLGMFNRTDEFYDVEVGGNVRIARHALGIDERRIDFEPTLWDPKEGLDLKQVWFSGVHSDIGGGYKPSRHGLASNYPLAWMIEEASAAGLQFDDFLADTLARSWRAPIHQSRRHIYRLRRTHVRPLHNANCDIAVHPSVRERWENDADYRPPNLVAHVEAFGWDEGGTSS